MKRSSSLLLLLALWSPDRAFASETINYTYDAKGRLTQVAHSGGPASGLNSTYTFDAADNRTNTSVTGAPSNSPAQPIVVIIPLSGLTPIVIPSAQ